MFLVTKWFGVFLIENNEIIDYILFPKNENEIIKRLNKIKKNLVILEEKKITIGKNVNVFEKRLEQIGNFSNFNSKIENIIIDSNDYGYSVDLLNKISKTISENTVKEKLISEDLQIIQMVNALDDLIKISNTLTERLNCWLVIPTPEGKIKSFKDTIATVEKEIKILEKQIDTDMKKIAPNTTAIIGSLIGARLISLAGGIDKLSFFPASTIQILGAEKALFRFKKEGGKPPKHGTIFQHSLINRSPLKHRGKIARLLANKISIAIKADVYTKRDISEEIIKDINNQIKSIRNK
jgi:nucleolar protein 56